VGIEVGPIGIQTSHREREEGAVEPRLSKERVQIDAAQKNAEIVGNQGRAIMFKKKDQRGKSGGKSRVTERLSPQWGENKLHKEVGINGKKSENGEFVEA